jgi:hypothetical protein
MARRHHHRIGRKNPIMQAGKHSRGGHNLGKSSLGTGHSKMRGGVHTMAAHMTHARHNGAIPHGKGLSSLHAHRHHSAHKHRGG